MSGYLYQSDVLMYDRQTESFWSQISSKAVVGPMTGSALRVLPAQNTTWAAWRKAHPRTRVLARDQGLAPPSAYRKNAYGGYHRSPRLMFPVNRKSDRLATKAIVFGLSLEDLNRAYPLAALSKGGASIEETVDGIPLKITFDAKAEAARAWVDGAEVPLLRAYWFAWFTFHPETTVYAPRPAGSDDD